LNNGLENPITIQAVKVLGNGDILIENLVNGKQTANTYNLLWEAGRYTSGIYFTKMSAVKYTAVRKMLLVK